MTRKNECYDDFENPNPEQYNFTSSRVTEAVTEKDWEDFWKSDNDITLKESKEVESSMEFMWIIEPYG